jgi:hypothetical protein
LSFKNKIKWGTTLLHRKSGEKLYQKVAMNHYSNSYHIDNKKNSC